MASGAPAQAHGLVFALVAQEVADMAARLGGLDEVEPGRIRTGVARGDDLDRLATLERRVQRLQAAVDARGDAAVAQLGMN